MHSYVEGLVERIRLKQAALATFTPAQQTGSSLAVGLAAEIETLRDEARLLRLHLGEDIDRLQALAARLDGVK